MLLSWLSWVMNELCIASGLSLWEWESGWNLLYLNPWGRWELDATTPGALIGYGKSLASFRWLPGELGGCPVPPVYTGDRSLAQMLVHVHFVVQR